MPKKEEEPKTESQPNKARVIVRRGLLVGLGLVGAEVVRRGTQGKSAKAEGSYRSLIPLVPRGYNSSSEPTPTPIGGASGPEPKPTRTPTQTPTSVDVPTPTEPPPPTTEGQPTLSVAEHFSRLQLIEAPETVNGVTVNIWKTNDAVVTARFATLQLKQEFARAIEANASRIRNTASTSDNAFNSADVVFVKNRGDLPNGTPYYTWGVNGGNDSFVYCGIKSYTRLDGRLVIYLGLEEKFDISNSVAVNNRNWSISRDPLAFSRDGLSPDNGIPATQEERSLLAQYPIRVS